MNRETVIENTVEFVKETLQGAEGGHDWFHTLRVWNTAQRIARTENVDPFVISLGALLHDIADAKFHGGDESVGPSLASGFLRLEGVDEGVVEHVVQIITHISFKGGNEVQSFRSPELDVVQDADRLDAVGAIGIARTFNYGGHMGRKLYDPDIKANLNMSKEAYRSSTAPTINHFYEKLLLLKKRMNTKAGRALAEGRHQFMEEFLDRFYREWEGES
ncbi:MAG: HD domain-containing protein [Sphaerochaetaceae bacterium]|nr:HD domain-containing protein [Sphaerochaetaceae bacterium]